MLARDPQRQTLLYMYMGELRIMPRIINVEVRMISFWGKLSLRHACTNNFHQLY